MSCARSILARRASEGTGLGVSRTTQQPASPRLRVGLVSCDIAAYLCATRVLTALGGPDRRKPGLQLVY